MCGINGIYAFHGAAGEPSEAELLRTRDAMQARGPDGAGLWWSAERRCGLGHRRLAIIDLSERAAQPFLSADGASAITFNGEIYNYRALRDELEQAGVKLRTTSDTEVLVELYAREGEAMVQRLRGMFALAIWDGTRQGLFLARDPYGIKPLYTANDGQNLRFASQVRALVAGGGVSTATEPAGLVGFHLWGHVPEPFTLYRDIRALPAGHSQWIDAHGVAEPKAYFNLAQILAEGARRPLPEQEIPIAVRTAVKDSVAAHLTSDVEVGVFLSAGVDSGALLGLMQEAGARNIPAITLSFREYHGTAEDEAPLAAMAAERYGARHIVRTVDAKEFRNDLPAIFAAMDQPSIDGINTWFVAKAAREAGLKVAISGLGGDELLAGYDTFRDVPAWHRRFGPVAAIPGVGLLARLLIGLAMPNLKRMRPKAAGMLEYAGSWGGAYLLRRGLFLPREIPADPELVREGLKRLAPLPALTNTLTPDPGSDNGRVCALESTHYMRNQLLRDADWAGMAHSIEIRTPLVDTTLARSLASAIPALKPGTGKAALANAPALPLPRQIVQKAKTGFGVPTGAWMAQGTQQKSAPGSSKGAASRRWSGTVLKAFSPLTAQ